MAHAVTIYHRIIAALSATLSDARLRRSIGDHVILRAITNVRESNRETYQPLDAIVTTYGKRRPHYIDLSCASSRIHDERATLASLSSAL